MYRPIQTLFIASALAVAGSALAQNAMSHAHQMAASSHGHGMSEMAHTPMGEAGHSKHGAHGSASSCGHEGMGRHDAHQGHGKGSHHMAERAVAREELFKAQLQLKPAQDAAWTAFLGAMKHSGGHAKAMPVAPMDLAKMSTPERLDAMQAQHERHRAEREAAMKARSEAVRTFYAVLEPDQKKVFDALSLRWMGGMKHHRHGQSKAHDAQHDQQGHHKG